MDTTDNVSSQESLILSQESYKYLLHEWSGNLNEDDISHLKENIDNNLLCKLEEFELDTLERSGNIPAFTSSDMGAHTNLNENSDNVIIPETSSSSSYVEMYTRLNVPINVSNSNMHEYTADEYLLEMSVSSSSQQANNSIPPSTDWLGDYSFTVSFHPDEKATKTTSWTYSDMKKKLYVNMAVACPINIHLKTKPPSGSIIRAMVIFSRSEHIVDVVKRCLNHSNPNDASNVGHPAPCHLVRCDNPSSEYVDDEITLRQSVIVPYEDPQVGMEYTTYLYRFMCLGSCVGGLNRRPIKLIITLENDNHCLGRKVVDLRICACPGRDKRSDEKQLEKHPLKRSSSTLKNNCIQPSGPPLKRQKSDSGDDESYTIVVHRRSHYEILKKMKDALEIVNLLTPEEIAILRQRQNRPPKKHKRENLQSSEESST